MYIYVYMYMLNVRVKKAEMGFYQSRRTRMDQSVGEIGSKLSEVGSVICS